MRSQQKELPIFLDVTGRRWKVLKLWFAALAVAAVVSVSWLGFRVASVDRLHEQPPTATSVNQLAEFLSHTNTPVIGNGPLARVVKIQGRSMSDVFSGAQLREMTQEEYVAASGYQYAIERYGDTASNKRIILTFDDGPDTVYTTQLLDVLSKESATASFFVVGSNVVKYPEVARRIVREGHDIANHSFSHANLELAWSPVAEQEIHLTSRILRATTGYSSTFFRPPYVGTTDQSLRDSLRGVLHGQRLGYTVALYDYDTADWRHATSKERIQMPPFDGRDHVLLLHDGGGDREGTIAYVKALITEAKQHGYQFASLSSLYPSVHAYRERTDASLEDRAVSFGSQVVLVWPLQIVFALFSMTVVFVFVGMGLYIILAILQNRRASKDAVLEKSGYNPAVAVLVPAYNEAKVLRSCVAAIRKSSYKNLKIIIIDDGSTDRTWKIALRLEKEYENVKAFHQENAGKPAALNLGIKHTWCPIIIGIDADTQFLPDTVSRLVRHFKDPRVGAVAGMVRVGNRTNILTRCQALEYATSISLERTAHTYLDAVTVVPGACGAWRRKAIVRAGRYSSETLAEDCDLTIGVHAADYRVLQDNTAIAITEVPTTLRNFARQRFRWAYGNMQVYWKYQDMLFTNKQGWLNSFVLPLAITATIGPVFFLPLLAAIALGNIVNGQYITLVVFIGVSLFFQVFRAWVSLLLGGESLKYLWLVPIARLLYGPLRIYLIYATVLRAFKGAPVGWNKLARTGMAGVLKAKA